MQQYANYCRVRFTNTVSSPNVMTNPNLSETPNVWITDSRTDLNARLVTPVASVFNLITSDYDTYVGDSDNGLTGGSETTAKNINDFIDKCQQIWIDRCLNSPKATYTYVYCHSNHSNHSAHGSRGRR